MINIMAQFALKILEIKAKAFEEDTKNPMRAQEKILFEYLKRNKDTEYGKKHNFSGVKSIDDYQRFVPLGDGESFRPYIERMMRGQTNVLIADKPTFFASTSGTTNKPKLIPVTKYSLAKKKDVTDLWAYYITEDHPDVLKGKILAIISPEVEGYTECGLAFGAESGHAYKNMEPAIRDFYALPYQVFEIEDYDARYYCMLRISMGQDITTIATLNPSTIVLLCQRIDTVKDKIIEDIEKGTLDREVNISDEIRKKIEKTLKPDPGRAGQLRRILKEKGKLLPQYFWPNLELIECWKGGGARLYLKELPQYFGDITIRDLGYLSTEARSSIPMSDAGAGGVLAINTNFYEFIPREEIHKEGCRALLSDQVEKGKEYLIIVTTPAGLYRYDIDDVIMVNGFFNKTPIVEFVQKGLNAVSLTGEKVYESHVSAAVNAAVEHQRLVVKFFSASAQWDNPPRYIFLVEFDKKPQFEKMKALLESIETELYRQNAEYASLRKQQLLASPILKVVKEGGFEKYRDKRIGEGVHDAQFKVPGLTSDFDFQKNFEISDEIFMEAPSTSLKRC